MAKNEISISQLGPQGDGIYFGRRGKVFVERSAPGDSLLVEIRRDKMGNSRGEITEILKPSAYRQAPPCPHYDQCGNCTLQHLNQRFYRSWKEGVVREAFAKVGLKPRQWLATQFVSENNRRRATFTAIKLKGQIRFGYYRRRSKEVIAIDECLVTEPALLKVKNALAPLLSSLLKEGKSLDVFVQTAEEKADLVVTGDLDPKTLAKLFDIKGVSRVSWRKEERSPARILFQKQAVGLDFGKLHVELPPDAFLQPTIEGEKFLVKGVLSALPQSGKFADLFSGCGTFTGPMLTLGSVDAFESVPSAVKALSQAAKGYPLKVFKRDLFKNPLKKEELRHYDAVVFDPPRAGCETQAWRLSQSHVPVLVGVSCNPATLARDARILCDGGYWLQSVQAVDQFLWSHHVEAIAVFTRKKSF